MAFAVEGMWLPQQMAEHSATLKAKGLQIDPILLSDLNGPILQSVVSLGFCSAAFISEDGLIATNHHCISTYLQHLEKENPEIINDGFLAGSHQQEKWVGPTGDIYLLQEIIDVTTKVQKGIFLHTSDNKRERLSSRNKTRLITACESKPEYRCTIQGAYQGTQFFLYRNVQLQDIRLVYAPPLSIGSFGGEVDNWQWPRHAGDFALLRAYVSSDGGSAAFSDENVPYQPKNHLNVNPKGISSNDFVSVIGFPGKTMRHSLAIELEYSTNVYYPWKQTVENDWIRILNNATDSDRNTQVRLASTMGGLQNSTKNTAGMLRALEDRSFLNQKRIKEQQYRNWAPLQNDGDAYLFALDELIGIIELEQQQQLQNVFLSYLQESSIHLSLILEAYTWVIEHQKPDINRKAGYQERDRVGINNKFRLLYQSHVPKVEQELFRYMLNKEEAASISFLQEHISKFDDPDQMITAHFDNQPWNDVEDLLDLLENTANDFQNNPNPWFKLATLFHSHLQQQNQTVEQIEGAKQRLQPIVIQGLKDAIGGEFYPDANGTLRITYGNIMGYSPAEAIYYSPQTTLDGLLAKVSSPPFSIPDWYLDKIPSANTSKYKDFMLGTIPVNFLSDLDVTGGNSGSPTINANGEFIGLLFDGNIESIASDWVFNPDLTRSIHADVRYLLWMLEIQEDGAWLLDEIL